MLFDIQSYFLIVFQGKISLYPKDSFGIIRCYFLEFFFINTIYFCHFL